ncbi:MAG TPA: ABC transporter substrate-binding protein, partial [Jiangellaceae bacterium]|nr:ABC transporter substrate-binding protein [Jiangellaceae bacterium]
VDAWNWVAYGPNAALNSYFFEPIEGFTEVQGEDANGDETITEDEAPVTEMSGLEVVDDTTFTVALTAPASSFPERIGYTAFSPLPEAFFEDPEAFGEAPIGSGPFEFVSWDKNVEINIARYADYAGETQPQIDEATFRIYEDDNAAYADLQAGNLDIMPQLPTAALAGEAYKTDLEDRFIEREVGVIQTVTFAPEAVDPSMANPELRQAISMAIDRPAIIEAIFQGTRTPATGWVSPVVSGFKPDACGEFCTFDAEAAKAKLAEAGGFDGQLTLSYNGDADHKGWVDATCNSIKNALGVDCVGVAEVDFATFRAKINDRTMSGMFRTGWQMDYPSVENFLVPIYATGASANDGDYSNPEFDAMVEEAASQQGEDAIATYNEAEALLAADMPAIPMWYNAIVAGYSPNVENVHITPFGTIDMINVTTTG